MMKRNLNSIIKILSFVVPVAAGSLPTLSGKDYYVAPRVGVRNVGSSAKPFGTIQQAADVMRPNDVCFIRGGAYRETVQIKFSGVKGKLIRFRSYPGETVISGNQNEIRRARKVERSVSTLSHNFRSAESSLVDAGILLSYPVFSTPKLADSLGGATRRYFQGNHAQEYLSMPPDRWAPPKC